MRTLKLLFVLSLCVFRADAVEVVVQSAHTAAITDLAYTTKGSLLISASDDGTARVWDANGHLLRLIEAHAGGVSGLAISYDNKYVVTGGKDGYAKVWSIDAGELIRQIALRDSITSVSCSSVAPQCAISAGTRLVLLPMNPTQEMRTLEALNPIAVRYMPNGKHIAVSSMSPGLRVIDSNSGQTVTQRNTQLPLSHLRTTATNIYGTTNYDILSFDSFDVAPGLRAAGSGKWTNSISGFDVDSTGHIFGATFGNLIPAWEGSNVTTSVPLSLPTAVYTSVALNSSDTQMAFGDAGGSLYFVDRATTKVVHQVLGHTDLVYHTFFSPGGALVVTGGQGAMTRVWTLGNEEQTLSFRGMALDVRAATWIKKRTLLVTSAPMQLTVWDVARGHMLRQLQTKDIDGWPMACHESGVCVWIDANNINVKNLLTDESVHTFSLGNDSAIGIDLSADRKYLAVAVNRAVVRIWSLATQAELAPMQLELPKSVDSISPYYAQSWQHAPKMYVPFIGMASALRFSMKGHRLAVANEVGIHLWDLDHVTAPQMLRGYSGHISFLDFEKGDTLLYSGGDDETIRMWIPGAGAEGKPCAHTNLVPANMSLSKDGVIGAISLPDGEVELWNLHDAIKLATIAFPGAGGWLAYTPEGLFEASEEAWKTAEFRFANQTTNLAPVEAYFQNYFEPGLLSDLLAGEAERHPADPAKLDRDAPAVTLAELSITQPSASLGTGPNTDLTLNPSVVRFRLEVKPPNMNSRISNTKVYQNGQLVKNWRGHLNTIGTSAVIEEFELPMTAGPNHISAVAFNEDGIQSQEAIWDLPKNNIMNMYPNPKLLVLAVGVSAYQDQRYNLQFPASDAALFAKSLDRPSTDWAAQQTRLMDWNMYRSIFEGGDQIDELPQQAVVKTLTNQQVTRGSILAAIKDVIALAKPQDTLILYFSGHGVVANQHFYFLPHNSAIQADPKKDIPEIEVEKAADTLLSDDDLEKALGDLNVAHAALIFDACRSGQALTGAELRGPRLYSGLGRLAYEKGIYLLAASEETEPAVQLKDLNQSVLTYALVREGLMEFKADINPMDGTIDLRKWLSYANARVPSLISETLAKKTGPTPQGRQHPRFSPRRIPEPTRLVLTVKDKRP